MSVHVLTETHRSPKGIAFAATNVARVVTGAVLASVATNGTAFAQQPETVASLLKQDFAVVSTVPSPIGPGLFLQKKDKLYLCFVAETPKSDAITTKYCKPVE